MSDPVEDFCHVNREASELDEYGSDPIGDMLFRRSGGFWLVCAVLLTLSLIAGLVYWLAK